MRRLIYQDLLDWKANPKRKPLIVQGARQVGKSHIIREFCQNEYDHYIEINLFNKEEIVQLYEQRISNDEKFNLLKAMIDYDVKSNDENFILFIDEIQESEQLISALKYFNENHPNLNIICAGSLLGVKLNRFNSSFPVGKVERLNMFPMNFKEFLMAFNEDLLVEKIEASFKNNQALIEPLHTNALSYFKYYLCVGGMPDSVLDLLENNRDIVRYNKNIISNIVEDYFRDMGKYVSNKSETLKIQNTYQSIVVQLSNEANKFQYSKIEKSARKSNYESALDWLDASNIVLKSYRVKQPIVPLKAFVDSDYFKLFYSDVGILINQLDLNFSDILFDKLTLYKGAIIENYVAQELSANQVNLFYWLSNGKAEIDFLLYGEEGVIPVEVKASENTKSKSLNTYIQAYQPSYSIRISSKNFGLVNGIKSVPLYAVFCIK